MADPLVPLLAATYHTIGPTLAYAEGDQYSISGNELVRNVIVCGFADVDPNPPVAPPDPPPEGFRAWILDQGEV